MAEIYKYEQYIDFLSQMIKENSEAYGYKAKIADACGCKRSYLTQVLVGKAHFTPEHAFNLCKFWRLSTLETEYFIHMVHKDRAGTKDLQNYHKKALRDIRLKTEDLSQRFTHETLKENQAAVYYSNWIYGALHVLISIREFQQVASLSSRLEIPQSQILTALKELEKLGLATHKNGQWVPSQKNLHVSKSSAMITVNHLNWRQKALQNSVSRDEGGIHYTSVYGLSHSDAIKLKDMMLAFIEQTRKVVAPSKEEEAICFLLDFFKI